jgi:hypothetical protein
MIILMDILLLALVIIVKYIGGGDDPYFYVFVFQCKLQICTQVGGALSIYFC